MSVNCAMTYAIDDPLCLIVSDAADAVCRIHTTVVRSESGTLRLIVCRPVRLGVEPHWEINDHMIARLLNLVL